MSRPQAPNLARELIGHVAWRRLVAWRGGCEYDVPGSLDCPSGVELATRIGADGARKLIDWAKGTRIYIAAGHAETLLARYSEIVAAHEQGQSPREIAMLMDFHGRYTERNVRMILSGRFEDFNRQFGNQEELF